MPQAVEEGADSDIDVIVEEESHSAGDGDAGLSPRRLDVLWTALWIGRQHVLQRVLSLEEGDNRSNRDPGAGEHRLRPEDTTASVNPPGLGGVASTGCATDPDPDGIEVEDVHQYGLIGSPVALPCPVGVLEEDLATALECEPELGERPLVAAGTETLMDPTPREPLEKAALNGSGVLSPFSS